jgi:hypothetical protein
MEIFKGSKELVMGVKTQGGNMEHMILIAGGLILMLGVSLLDSEGIVGNIAFVMTMIGLVLLCAFLMRMEPAEAAGLTIKERQSEQIADEEVYIKGAGVTAHMNAVLRNALREEPPELKLTNEEEIELLARLITAETGGTDEYLSYLTGSVVINRMKSDKFPNTVFAVIYQKNQYECTWNGHIYKPYTDLAWEIAEELLTYGTTIDESVVYQSEFTQGGGVFQQIGRTYFCYE